VDGWNFERILSVPEGITRTEKENWQEAWRNGSQTEGSRVRSFPSLQEGTGCNGAR